MPAPYRPKTPGEIDSKPARRLLDLVNAVKHELGEAVSSRDVLRMTVGLPLSKNGPSIHQYKTWVSWVMPMIGYAPQWRNDTQRYREDQSQWWFRPDDGAPWTTS